MLPFNYGGHSAYQDSFVSDFLDFYPNPFVLSKNTWDIIIEFWHLDLSQTDVILKDCYSKYGLSPRLPSCMLRSYLLSKFKITSITDWVSKLKECPLYAILSGFSINDVPGVGTFYDFLLVYGSLILIIFLPMNVLRKRKLNVVIKHLLIPIVFVLDYFNKI